MTFTFIQHYFFFLLLFLLLLGFLRIADFISVPRIPSIADLDVTSLITNGEKPETGTLKSCIHCNIHYLKYALHYTDVTKHYTDNTTPVIEIL